MKNDMPELKARDMPDELYVYNDKSSIGDFGFTSMSPKYGYIKYNRASPHQCCGARGKEACMRHDQDGEECDVKRAGVDDGLRAAVETLRKHISAPQHYYLQPFEKHIETIITHALKTREKVVSVQHYDTIVKNMANLLAMFLRMYETARSQARDYGSREMVKEFNDACAEGGRIHRQITDYFAVKTIAEARELLKQLGGKTEIEFSSDNPPNNRDEGKI